MIHLAGRRVDLSGPIERDEKNRLGAEETFAILAFQDDLATHIDRIRNRIPHVQGEEATKQALVVPLLQVLGYDVFDPREVRPEYVADFAVKKAGQFEKIDYAICINGAPAIFIECKAIGAALEDHGGQVSRYFNATPSVRVAIITDGVKIRVFTDLQQPNIMDQNPWLSVDLLSVKPAEVDVLRRFRKADFSPGDMKMISTWVREAIPNAPIGYRDSKTYFTIHQDNTRKWFVRLAIEKKPMWVALRHVKPDDAKKLAPGLDVVDGSQFGDSRIMLPTLGDLPKMRTAIIAAYEREAARKGEDGPEGADV